MLLSYVAWQELPSKSAVTKACLGVCECGPLCALPLAYLSAVSPQLPHTNCDHNLDGCTGVCMGKNVRGFVWRGDLLAVFTTQHARPTIRSLSHAQVSQFPAFSHDSSDYVVSAPDSARISQSCVRSAAYLAYRAVDMVRHCDAVAGSS